MIGNGKQEMNVKIGWELLDLFHSFLTISIYAGKLNFHLQIIPESILKTIRRGLL
jgi:hypothetical protein